MENKTHNGIEYKQALKEIKRLEESQIVFKEDKKEIETLKKKIISLEKENNSLKNKAFNIGLKKLSVNEVKREKLKRKTNGDIKYLNRILLVLKDSKESIAQGMVSKLCFATGKEIYPCIGFLEKNGMIKSIKEKGKTRYYI